MRDLTKNYLARIIGLLAKVMREEHTADFVIILPIGLSSGRDLYITYRIYLLNFADSKV